MSSIPCETLERMIQTATLAPSSHNTQPWRFAIRDHTIELWADRTRRLPVTDPGDRELTISCGAALLTFRATVAHSGLAATTTLQPIDGEPDLLATLDVGDGNVDAGLSALFPHIAQRHTYRDAFADPDSQDPAVTAVGALIDAAAREGAALTVLDGTVRSSVCELIEEGDRLQLREPRWRRELASWMHSRRHGDGLTMAPVALPISRLVVSTVDLGKSTGAKDRKLAHDADVLAVITTTADRGHDWLVAGQALQRLLLTAVEHGWQAGFLNQPCQVDELRPKLQELLATEQSPQIVVRLGRPRRQRRSAPRRPLGEVLRAADVP